MWGLLGAEEKNHLPQPAGHASFDAAQDIVGFRGCLEPFSTHPVVVLGIALTEVQDLHLALLNFMRFM
ncbi:hypothetical protein WISP_18133 [Willisornis vidua]|uniref:Uncharacterized protein n=1 Tax=Willisornis vidua TaxID=1566151 RepID=A0ABQ9DVI3_9PASS|nr:hypothetical protein WISP_18133 [Willisornis vidua]